MHLHTLFPLFGVLVLTTANRQGQLSCASFKTDTTLIPANDGYNATLTFRVLNTCKSDVKSIKLFRGVMQQYPKPTCSLNYNHGICHGMGCKCVPQSESVHVDIYIHNLADEICVLEGVLKNGTTFRKAVVFNCERVTTEKHCAHVMVAAVSACAAVGVIIIICFFVDCIRKGCQASPTSRQSARGCSGRPLPQQPPSPRAQDEGPPQDHSSHKYDNEAGAFGVATGAQSASKGDNHLQAVRSAASQARFHRHHARSGSSLPCSPVYDGDGYLLADPPLFLRTKRHASKPLFVDSKV